MKIQFWGDAAGTGFGTVTRELGQALLDLGHDVRFVSQNDVGADLPEPFASRTFRITPELIDVDMASKVGENSLALNVEGILKLIRGDIWQDEWKPEAAIMVGDFNSVRRLVMSDEDTMAAFAVLPTYHYCPIEGIDIPPAWRLLWTILRPIAMCNAGADEIERVTGSRPPVIYHGVNTDTFWPVSPFRPIYLAGKDKTFKLRSKDDCKRFFGAPKGTRWVLRTDRFMPRKRYGSLLRAMAPVLTTRPDVLLMMHCRSSDEGGHLYDLISKYPMPVARRMLVSGFHDQFGGAPPEILNALYNAADVYASPSAEGFGLTIAEALACGTPAVGMDYSSVPEVIGPGGLLAPVNRLDDNEYDYAWATVDETKFGEAVASLLDDESRRKEVGSYGTDHVRANFTWSGAAAQFAEAMAERAEVAA